MALLAPLRSRDFRLFWLGQWVSQCGDNVFLVAQAWLAYALTGSPVAMVNLTLCSQIPTVATLLLGGAVVDRLPRRGIALCSDLLRATLLLAAAALQVMGRLRPWHLYLLAAAFGLVSAFARPAFRALVQALAPPAERTAANSLVSGGALVAGVAGPALGGLIMALGGAALAFALDGLSFLAGALGLLLARPPEPAVAGGASGLRLSRLLRDLVPALRLLVGRRFLLATVLITAAVNLTGQAPVVVLRPWLASRLGGAGVLSLGYTCFAAGMGSTLTLLSTVRLRRRRGPLIYAGLGLAGVCEAALALAVSPWQFWLAELGLGAAVMVYGVLWEGLLQDRVPPAAMGRVAALDEFVSSLLYPVGISLVGLFTRWPGPGWVLFGGGALTAVVAGLGLLLPWVRAES